MLDAAKDILFAALDDLKKEQIYLAKLAGRGEDKLRPFRRRFVKVVGSESTVVVESMTKVKQREEELREERKARRTERIFSIQNKVYEIQSAIDVLKSLEDAGPDDAVEYEVDTVVDDYGNIVPVDKIVPDDLAEGRYLC